MTTRQCPNCGATVNSEAIGCPSCGARFKTDGTFTLPPRVERRVGEPGTGAAARRVADMTMGELFWIIVGAVLTATLIIYLILPLIGVSLVSSQG